MGRFWRSSFVLVIILLLWAQAVAAAPAKAVVQKVRFSQSPDKVRIVFDVNVLPEYSVDVEQNGLKIRVLMKASLQKGIMTHVVLNDPVVQKMEIIETGDNDLQAVIDLKSAAAQNVFVLKQPNRLVIDLIKIYEQKITQEISPGLEYTAWYRGTKEGPLAVHILKINPAAGFEIRPLLSNDVIAGLETVSEMAGRNGSLAAVNASYFEPSGNIIGLLKIDEHIVSTSDLQRTAVGMMPDGKLAFDAAGYSGFVKMPNGEKVNIDGVNQERGTDALILYNGFYGSSTGTNEFGTEYSIVQGKVTAIGKGNALLDKNTMVLSAHGKAAEKLAGLKVGDTVEIVETLGEKWDKAAWVLGAGPRLIKNGNIYLTTKIEEFGSDVAGGRAPRTAIGTTKDGKILLVVVDGRQAHSIGMTLLELGFLLQELGAVEGMNLDGGGSSTMAVNYKVVNKPSDGRERKVGAALAVFRRQM